MFHFIYSRVRIDIGQGINVGPGKFGKQNKRRAWKIRLNKMCKNCAEKKIKLKNIRSPWRKINTLRAFNKAVGPGKN